MTDSNSLSSIAVGDVVTVDTSRYGHTNGRRETVTKITATQIVCDRCRFRKDDGKLIGGDSWNYEKIVTGERADRIKRAIKLAWLNDIMNKPRTLDRPSIEAMRAAADEAEAWLRESGEWDTAPPAPEAAKGPDHG